MNYHPAFVSAYVTQILISDSRIPSNFSLTYLSCLSKSLSSNEIDFSRSYVKESLTFNFMVLFSINIKSQGCEKPTDGAWWAGFKILTRISSGIFYQ